MQQLKTAGLRARSRKDFLVKAGAFLAVAGVTQSLDAHSINSDIDILNFALCLERLEASFYSIGLARFSPADFASSQFGQVMTAEQVASAYAWLQQIGQHEQTHVKQLSAAIVAMGGTTATADCYDFQTTGGCAKSLKTPDTFIQVAMDLENTGVMVYHGAVSLIEDPALRTIAAIIATVEARHAAYLNEFNGIAPFPAAIDSPATDTPATYPRAMAVAELKSRTASTSGT
jgi:hypothetical protein